jgi:alpha-glucosidase (family GH31 glycosyl hydrolase)
VHLPAGKWIDYETGEIFTGPATLNARSMPIGAMPLFIGRTGVIVEADADGKLWANVYPQVADGSAYAFIDRDGQRRSQITVEAAGADPAGVIVQTATGDAVATQPNHHGRALRFVLTPGVSYRVVHTAGAAR